MRLENYTPSKKALFCSLKVHTLKNQPLLSVAKLLFIFFYLLNYYPFFQHGLYTSNLLLRLWLVPYSGKFLNGAKFHIKLHGKIFPKQNFEDVKLSILAQWAQNSLRSRVKDMALYWYFQHLDALPDPKGRLSSSVSPLAIKDANEAVKSATRATLPRGR